MLDLHPEFVVNEEQKPRAVLLPYEEWEKVVEEMEELDDIRAYDEAKTQPSDSIPFDTAVREIREGGVS
jgi:PHD/YefM family antitoxin component YafN of YafNO toxin-antitoxin module